MAGERQRLLPFFVLAEKAHKNKAIWKIKSPIWKIK